MVLIVPKQDEFSGSGARRHRVVQFLKSGKSGGNVTLVPDVPCPCVHLR
jgi:hypothetical protein